MMCSILSDLWNSFSGSASRYLILKSTPAQVDPTRASSCSLFP
jgi:hypothetical protein